MDFLEQSTLGDLVRKFYQFINFNIYLWKSKTEEVEEPVEETEEEKKADEEKEEKKEEEDEDSKVEEDEEKKPKTKKVEKTVWDWELLNGAKPIWLRKQKDVADDEYNEFYKAIAKDSEKPMA